MLENIIGKELYYRWRYVVEEVRGEARREASRKNVGRIAGMEMEMEEEDSRGLQKYL